MAYVIPKCECGGFLQYHQDIVQTLSSDIKSDGRISKRAVTVAVDMTPIRDRFVCYDCKKKYISFMDKRGRIVKGDVIG